MSTVPKSDSNKTIYVLLAGAVAILLVCGGIFVATLYNFIAPMGETSTGKPKRRPNQTFPTGEGAAMLNPDQVVRAFFKELAASQFEDAYQRTSVGFQGQMSQNDFNEFIRKNNAFIGHLSLNYSTTGQTDSGIKKYKGKAYGGENGGVSFSLELSHEDEGWRVSSFSAP